MKHKIILPTFFSLLIGSYLGYLIFNQYKISKNDSVFSEKEIIYFLQQGVYSSLESIEENTTQISDYIYTKEDDKYRVYVGLTTNKNNAQKISNIYKEKNYDIYIKEMSISDKSFIEKLKQYDQLIEVTEDYNVILGIVKQVLNEYELVVKNNE